MIYFNNAATSYPKPACVFDAMRQNLEEPPANPYRRNDHHKPVGFLLREGLAKLLRFDSPDRIALCSGATEALNIAINGLVKPGCHAITTKMEHNSVLRPLFRLQSKAGLSLDILNCDRLGAVSLSELVNTIRSDTCLVAVNHASNVTGQIQDIRRIYAVVAKLGIPLLVDLSQSAGAFEIDLSEMPGLVAVFTGHKSLLGPSGTGGLMIGPDVDLKLWKVGGTGIRSDLKTMPDMWPLKFEPGTPNYPGIAGLGAAVEFLAENKEKLWQNKEEVSRLLWSALNDIEGIQLFCAPPPKNPCGVFSFKMEGWQSRDLGFALRESFGVQVRTGLHCAPLIHEAAGTFPEGTVRISLSPFNTKAEVESFACALKKIREAA